MTLVGVRELRQRASELLRLVAKGKVVEITDRGRVGFHNLVAAFELRFCGWLLLVMPHVGTR